MTVSNMKAVESAKAPDKPAAPKLLVYLVLGAFVGVGMGVGLVFLAEYIDDSIRSKDDLRLAWPIPVLGMVPNYKPRPAARYIDSLPATDPLFESYRGIRSSIAFAGVDSPITILTVTSCAPGEGKSTFCTNLGICLASDGQKVVIVDCDLRRPTQHRSFPTLSNQRGVSSVLTGNCTLAEAIQESPVSNLHFLTSGPLPTNPGRLVESLRLRSLVTELARSYDMVIIDAPPLLAVADALALSRASRATMVVVEHGKTTRRMVTDLRGRMESGGVEPIGVVLNKVDPKSGSYGSYQKYARLYAKRPTEVPPFRAGGEAS
jgi:succinoglycan biosynthesis transport protein ExoP